MESVAHEPRQIARVVQVRVRQHTPIERRGLFRKRIPVALAQFLEQLRVLDEPAYGMYKRTVTQLKNDVDEKKRLLDRVQSQAKSKESQAVTDLSAKKSVYEMESDRYRDYQEEVRKCKLYAPQDGLVVYYGA